MALTLVRTTSGLLARFDAGLDAQPAPYPFDADDWDLPAADASSTIIATGQLVINTTTEIGKLARLNTVASRGRGLVFATMGTGVSGLFGPMAHLQALDPRQALGGSVGTGSTGAAPLQRTVEMVGGVFSVLESRSVDTQKSIDTDYRFSLFVDAASVAFRDHFEGVTQTPTPDLDAGQFGLYFAVTNVTLRCRVYVVQADRIVTVHDVPLGGSARIKDHSGDVVRQENESGGTAVLDIYGLELGTSSGVQAHSVEILDDEGSVVYSFTDTSGGLSDGLIAGGDVFEVQDINLPPGQPSVTEREPATQHVAKLLLTGGSGADSHTLYRNSVPIDTFGALETPEPYNDEGLDETTCYEYVLRAENPEGTTDSDPLTVCTPGYGAPPHVDAITITDTSANLVPVLPEPNPYTAIRLEVRPAGGGVFFADEHTGGDVANPFLLTGLDPDTTYEYRAQGSVSQGLTDWSDWLTFTTAAPGPDPSIPTLEGMHSELPVGFIDPLPGQPAFGEAYPVRWRTPDPAQKSWDLFIRADETEPWGDPIAVGVGGTLIEDRDGYRVYEHEVDFSAFADGPGYQLRAVASQATELFPEGEEIEHFAFSIDNERTEAYGGDGDTYWWAGHQQFFGESVHDLAAADPLTDADKYGVLWAGMGWLYGWAGSQATVGSHPPTVLVHREIPLTRGADIVTRLALWSPEPASKFWGYLPSELHRLGVALMARGTGPASEWHGLEVTLSNHHTTLVGCCDDYLTSHTARVAVHRREGSSGATHLGNVINWPIPKGWWKAVRRPPWCNEAMHDRTYFEMDLPRTGQVCDPSHRPRRYALYDLRAKAETVPDTDDKHLRLRVAVRGPGIVPASYWQIDETLVSEEPWECGHIGLFRWQNTTDSLAGKGAGEVFSLGVYSTEQDCEAIPDPDPVPELEEELIGAPCTLILTKYKDDRETVDWIVSDGEILPTFAGEEVLPFLCTPEHYGEQEIDVATGAATITQVEVAIVDPRQIPGDQDSGWMTERLSRDGMGDIHGSRFQLVRFISEALGRVVIVDGPAGVARMDDTYAAFRAVLRDTRETERKIRAFQSGGTTTLLPMGVLGGYGFEGGEWLVDPTEPLLGRFNIGFAETPGPTTGIVNLQSTPGNAEALRLLTMDAYAALQGEVEFGESVDFGDRIEHHYRTHFRHLKLMWRAQGSSDEWSEIPSPHLVIDGIAEEAGGAIDPAHDRLVLSNPWPDFETETHRVATSVFIGDARVGPGGPHGADPQPGASLPEHNQDIELIVVYTGPPTPKRPFHIEGLTLGEFVKNAYDGAYSPRDPVTGDIAPTGIRYNAADVLAMTEPVRARITEPAKDLRDWLEKHGYAPAGWVPALNHDADISPIYQAPPEDMSEAVDIDNAITEPAPSWDAGERIINVLEYRYPRHYIPAVQDDDAPADGILERAVEVHFVDDQSIKRHGEEVQEYDAKLFAAVGTEDGASLLGVQDETGHQQAQLKRLYVFDRYRNGAQGFRVAVMREHTWMLRAGSWVTCDLSWFPDYTTRRRGMVTGGQIVAIRDLDCAWREILFEEALFVPVPPPDPVEES